MGSKVKAVRTITWKKEPKKGDPGAIYLPRGEWDADETYTRTAEVIMYVTFEGYAYEPATASVKGGSHPKADVQKGGGKWKSMGRQEVVATRVLLADFAILAGAVFWGNKLMSQHGVDNNGNESNAYTEYSEDSNGNENGNFHPNMVIDFLTGKGSFSRGNFRFDDLGNVSIKGALALPYRRISPVNGGILDLSQGSYFMFVMNYLEHGDCKVYLPAPSEEYNGMEVRIYSGFKILRSSVAEFKFRIEGSQAFYYPGYDPFRANGVKEVVVSDKEIRVRCVPHAFYDKYLWYLENHSDFASGDLHATYQ